MNKNKPLVLILCGGESLRLWPLSEEKSKNFLNIFGFSPLELTIKRFLKVTTKENIFLVANIREKKEILKLKLVNKINIFFEPQSKNTAPAILLSLQYLKNYQNSQIIIAPVDALIDNKKEFYKAINKSLKVAAIGSICTLGVVPYEANSNFGYIQIKKPGNSGVFSVKKFIEKPELCLAKRLIKNGDCFYNSGMFVSTVGTLIDEYKKHYPCYRDFVDNFSKKSVPALYRKIKSVSFDKAIMEKSKKIKLIKSLFFWKDFGSWDAIYDILSKDKNKNVIRGDVNISEGKNSLIYSNNHKKKIIVLGLEDVFYIDTEKYALIASRQHLSKLKAVLTDIRKKV